MNTATAALDASIPNRIRIRNYLLGGKDNYAADRAVGDALEAVDGPRQARPGILPNQGVRQRFADSREFILAVARRAAGAGIGQFLELGAGLAAGPSVHQAARDVNPDARVVYVEDDPVAVAHARALLVTGDGLSACAADPADPAVVLASPDLLDVIDLSQPVCVIAGSVAHRYEAGTFTRIVAGYAERLAPRSRVAVSTAYFADADLLAEVRSVYTACEVHNHDGDTVAGFLSGLEVVKPGVTSAEMWVAKLAEKPLAQAAYMLAGAGVKR